MQNEQENNERAEKQTNARVEQVKQFCAELPPTAKVILVGADAGETGALIKSLHLLEEAEKAVQLSKHGAILIGAHLVTAQMIRNVYKNEKLCVIVEDADELNIPVKKERTYTLTNSYIKPYEPLGANEAYIGQTPDPKKKHWDKPTYMGGDEKIPAYRSGGNNRKTKKRKKAKNGRNKK